MEDGEKQLSPDSSEEHLTPSETGTEQSTPLAEGSSPLEPPKVDPSPLEDLPAEEQSPQEKPPETLKDPSAAPSSKETSSHSEPSQEQSPPPELTVDTTEGQRSSQSTEQNSDQTNGRGDSGVISEGNDPKEPAPKPVVNGGDAGLDRSEPFHPWFKSAVTNAIKNGENITFTVETTRLDESGKQSKVDRVYEDFEWLHHGLTTDIDIGGIVVPPLPLKPVASAAEAAAKSRKELGSGSKTLKGDEFEKDMRKLEKYLSSLIKHSVFGREIALAKFLTETNPPVRAKLRKNILNNLTKAVEGVIKGGHQDVDETFQKHRLNAANMVPLARDMNTNFQAMVNHSERLSGALNHFSTALCLVSSADSSKTTAFMNEMQLTFARSMEHLSHASAVFSVNDDRTLGFTLDLYNKYAEAVKQMLVRRTVKLYELDSAVKSFEKAKPLKKQAAEELKNQRDKEFNDISETARQELTIYKQQRIIDFQQALVLYAEAKIKTARDTYALLAKDLSAIKTMELDGS